MEQMELEQGTCEIETCKNRQTYLNDRDQQYEPWPMLTMLELQHGQLIDFSAVLHVANRRCRSSGRCCCCCSCRCHCRCRHCDWRRHRWLLHVNLLALAGAAGAARRAAIRVVGWARRAGCEVAGGCCSRWNVNDDCRSRCRCRWRLRRLLRRLQLQLKLCVAVLLLLLLSLCVVCCGFHFVAASFPWVLS